MRYLSILIFCSLCHAQIASEGQFCKNQNKFHALLSNGGGEYSVLAPNRIVIQGDSSLLVMKSNKVAQQIQFKEDIWKFSVNTHGNGLLCASSGIYHIDSLHISTKPILLFSKMKNNFSGIAKIDIFQNDSFRIINIDEPKVIAFGHLYTTKIESDVFYLDSTSGYGKLLLDQGAHYIGKYDNRIFLLDCMDQPGIDSLPLQEAILTAKDYSLKTIMKIKKLGYPITLSTPIRYNENTGDIFFFEVKHDCAIIRKFSIRELLIGK
jgi:hypothetical protein